MKKIFFGFCILLIAANLFAIRLGVLQSNWQGWLQGSYYSGVRVEQTAPGYPAYGVLQPGDIITEALLIPNSQIWNNPYNPNGGFMMQLNPYYPISGQISVPWYQVYGLQYMNTTDQNAFSAFIGSAMYGSNVVLRIFRPGWNAWTLASVVLDTYGNGSVWMMQSPVQQQQSNQIVVQPGPSQQGQIQVQTNTTPQLQIWININ
jgi:hypothetical protein